MSIQIVHLIKTELSRLGSGNSPQDPVRIITQYWNLDGSLEFEIDPFEQEKRVQQDAQREAK